MANNILVTSDCARVEELANIILGYKAYIEQCVASFNYCVKNPDVLSWIVGTEAGQETLENVLSNNQNLLLLADNIQRIYQVTMTLVWQSEQANSGTNN